MQQAPPATSQVRPPSWQIILAFAVIYLVWGSTFLAIRVGVREIPPLLMAAMRFLVAGALLYGWTQLRRTAAPTRREWASAVLLSIPIFVIDYGLVFWAEQRVPSGITAVILATIPVFLALFEITFLRARRFTLRLGIALFLGVLGVAALVNNSPSLGGAPIDRRGLLALLIASLSWSAASAFTSKFRLPASKPMSSAAQMLAGGWLLLAVAAASGELATFHFSIVSARAWFALIYLIVPGSVVAFTAYLWLLHYESPTKVGTYAYVNPVVAVIIGAVLGGESIGLRTIAATALILISVLLIASGGGKSKKARNALAGSKRARVMEARVMEERSAHEKS
jgi:drug/metabolite transporter (DMT)-like permease